MSSSDKPRWEHPFRNAMYLGKYKNWDGQKEGEGWFVPSPSSLIGSFALRFSDEPSDYASTSVRSVREGRNANSPWVEMDKRLREVSDER